MQMFSAGHGPLLFYRAETDSVEELPVNALPLGLMDEEKSERMAREVRFMPGDMLIGVTDGFFEWTRADGELYGTDRLKEAFRSVDEWPLIGGNGVIALDAVDIPGASVQVSITTAAHIANVRV